MGRPKGSRNKPKITHAEAAVANEAAQTEYRGQKKRGRPKKVVSTDSQDFAQNGKNWQSDDKTCNDGHPHGGAPCDKPKGHEGLHDNIGAAEETSPQSPPSNQTQQRVITDLNTGEVLGPAFDITAPSSTKYSHSFVQTLAKCTAAGYFRKSHAKALKVFALERGSCVHFLIEEWEKHGKDPVKGLPEAWRHYLLDNADQMSDDDKEKIQKEYAATEQMLSEFVHENRDIRDKIRPEDVEVPFEIEVPLNIGNLQIKRTIVGKIDLIVWLDDERTKYNLIDHKTTATVPGRDELALDTQFSIYQLAAEKLFGKPPLAMFYYHLKGTHMCEERFSKVAHPREIGQRKSGCEIAYATRVPKKTPEAIQSLLDTYYAPNIIRWEAQSVGKDGLSDPKNRCVRCEYRETCQKTTAKDLPVPLFIR